VPRGRRSHAALPLPLGTCGAPGALIIRTWAEQSRLSSGDQVTLRMADATACLRTPGRTVLGLLVAGMTVSGMLVLYSAELVTELVVAAGFALATLGSSANPPQPAENHLARSQPNAPLLRRRGSSIFLGSGSARVGAPPSGQAVFWPAPGASPRSPDRALKPQDRRIRATRSNAWSSIPLGLADSVGHPPDQQLPGAPGDLTRRRTIESLGVTRAAHSGSRRSAAKPSGGTGSATSAERRCRR
jgi:hypothetical protein